MTLSLRGIVGRCIQDLTLSNTQIFDYDDCCDIPSASPESSILHPVLLRRFVTDFVQIDAHSDPTTCCGECTCCTQVPKTCWWRAPPVPPGSSTAGALPRAQASAGRGARFGFGARSAPLERRCPVVPVPWHLVVSILRPVKKN